MKKLFNTLIQKNEQASLSSTTAQLERLSQGLLKTLMSFVITGGKRSTLELGPHVFPTPRTFAKEPAAPAGAAQPGIAQDSKVINLHGGGSTMAPTVSTSCVSLSPAAFLRTSSRLPVAFRVPSRKSITAATQTPERPFYYAGRWHEIIATSEHRILSPHTRLKHTLNYCKQRITQLWLRMLTLC